MKPFGVPWRVLWKPGLLRKGDVPYIFVVGQLAHTQLRRFPIVSGFRVTWDSSRPKGQRVVSIHLAVDQNDSNHDDPSNLGTPNLDGAPVERQRGGRTYKIVTRQYMAEGHDGYDALKGCKYLVDDENGKLMSTLVRQYLLGAQKLEDIPFLLKHDPEFRLSIYQQVHSPAEYRKLFVFGREDKQNRR